MFNYQDEFMLINDVKIKILGVFHPEHSYSIDISGIKTRISDELLKLLINKFEGRQIIYQPIEEEVISENNDESINEEIVIEKIKKPKKKKKE